MSLIANGRAAILAMAGNEALFDRIPQRDWAAAAVRLARKQLISAGQTRESLREMRRTLGEDMFEKALDGLSAHHAKLLARRIDPASGEEALRTGATALAHIREVLRDDFAPQIVDHPAPGTEDPSPDPPAPANPYLGRKAFRTGR